MKLWLELLLKRYFRWTALVVALIVLGTGYSLVLAKKISQIQSGSAVQRAQAEQDLATQTKLRDSLQVSIKRYKSIFTDVALQKVSDTLHATSDFPSLLLTVPKIATTAAFTYLDSFIVSA